MNVLQFFYLVVTVFYFNQPDLENLSSIQLECLYLIYAFLVI